MVITPAFRAALIALIQTTSDLKQVADNLRVYLVNQVFTPEQVLLFGDVTTATFTGGAFKMAELGNPDVYTDPTTGIQYLQLKDPVGGWSWICTAAPVAPESIYGFIVTTKDTLKVLGAFRFVVTVVITLVGDAVHLGQVRYVPAAILLS